MSGNLRKRLAVAAVGIPLCVLVAYVGGYLFAAGIGVVAAAAFWEFARMSGERGGRALSAAGIVSAFLMPAVALASRSEGVAIYAAVLALALPAVAVATRDIEANPVRSAALAVFGVLYTAGLLSFAIPLREGWAVIAPGGPAGPDRTSATLLFFFPVAIVWIADTAAYFGGRAFGKRRLAPRISPGKTIAGGVCALLASIAAAALYSRLLPQETWAFGMPATLGFGLAVGAFAIVGDLVESALKRECGRKDSSNLLPGHGGMLDRIDSLLWALPAAFLFLAFFG